MSVLCDIMKTKIYFLKLSYFSRTFKSYLYCLAIFSPFHIWACLEVNNFSTVTAQKTRVTSYRIKKQCVLTFLFWTVVQGEGRCIETSRRFSYLSLFSDSKLYVICVHIFMHEILRNLNKISHCFTEILKHIGFLYTQKYTDFSSHFCS